MPPSPALLRTQNTASRNPDDQVRAFLAALRDGKRNTPEAPAVHRILAHLAHRAAPWLKGHEPDELVSDFVIRMLEKKPEARRDDFEKLLALEPRRLAGTLAHRFRQLAAEQAPRSALRKTLREHVTAVWDSASPHADGMPSALLDDDRISRSHVRIAVGNLRGEPGGMRLDKKAAAERLLQEYFPEPEDLDAMPESETERIRSLRSSRDPEERLRRQIDAHRLARDLQRALGPELTDVLARRFRGDTLQEIARARGYGNPARVFERLEGAREIVQRTVHVGASAGAANAVRVPAGDLGRRRRLFSTVRSR
jgi:hypothetical protein